MSNYIMNVDEKEKTIVKIVKSKSFTFSSKSKKYKYVKNISIYDPEKIEKLLINRIIKRITKLDKLLMLIADDDDTTPADVAACLDENYRIQEILKTKYKNFLTKEYYDYFIKKLCKDAKILEQVVVEMNYSYEPLEEENHKSR